MQPISKNENEFTAAEKINKIIAHMTIVYDNLLKKYLAMFEYDDNKIKSSVKNMRLREEMLIEIDNLMAPYMALWQDIMDEAKTEGIIDVNKSVQAAADTAGPVK